MEFAVIGFVDDEDKYTADQADEAAASGYTVEWYICRIEDGEVVDRLDGAFEDADAAVSFMEQTY